MDLWGPKHCRSDKILWINSIVKEHCVSSWTTYTLFFIISYPWKIQKTETEVLVPKFYNTFTDFPHPIFSRGCGFRCLIYDLSSSQHGFDPRSVRVPFLVEKMAQRKFWLRVFGFPMCGIIPAKLAIYPFINLSLTLYNLNHCQSQ
jgi:hypothetical protein